MVMGWCCWSGGHYTDIYFENLISDDSFSERFRGPNVVSAYFLNPGLDNDHE